MVAIELVRTPPTAEEDRLSAISSGEGSAAARDTGSVGVMDSTAEATANEIEGIAASSGKVATNVFSAEFEGGDLYGRVVGVLRRNWRIYAGSLEGTSASGDLMEVTDSDGIGGKHSTSTLLFCPVNKRVPRVLISTRRAEELLKMRLLVSIDHWPADSPHPQGHLVKTLGEAGDKLVETAVLLHEFDVPYESFSPEVMACLPPADWKISEEVVAQRTDLRHIPVVSIDPPGCKDIDDALHCVRLPNGRLEAGVHIAGTFI